VTYSSGYWANVAIDLGKTVTTKLVVGLLLGARVSGTWGFLRVGSGALNTSSTSADDILYFDATNGRLYINGTYSANGIVSLSGYYYITVEYNFSSGTVDVYLDGGTTPIISATTSLTSADRFNLGVTTAPSSSSFQNIFDDIYALDDSGTENTSRLGVIKVRRAPLVAEVETNFTPMGGATTNISAVNKTNRSTTTYNQSPDTNDLPDTFTIDTSAVPSGATVHAVAMYAFHRKVNANPRTLALIARDDTDEFEQEVTQRTGDFGADMVIMETMPDGSPLTPAAIADLEVGYEAKA